MEKRYKTDYFEKLDLLSSICCNNISYSNIIIASEKLVSTNETETGAGIIKEIKTCLEKDYFAPFEREDIFLLSIKLNELSVNSRTLCICAQDSDFFGFPSNIISLASYLKNIADLMKTIFTRLKKYPKQDNLSVIFEKTELLHTDFSNQIYYCLKQSKNNTYNTILHLIEKCEETCMEIIHLIQYTLLKNS